MKAFLAIMLALFLVQPAPAFSCAMHGDAGADESAQAVLDMDAEMGHGMDHGMSHGMDHTTDSDIAQQPAKHDCCSPDDSGADTCSSADCLSCVAAAAFSAPPASVTVSPLIAWTQRQQDQLAPSHDLHPYRPPKNIS